MTMARLSMGACAALAVLTIFNHAAAQDGSDYAFVYCEDWIQTENADGSKREDYYYTPAMKVLTSTWRSQGFSQNEFELHLTDYNSVIVDKHLKDGQVIGKDYCRVLAPENASGDDEQTKIKNIDVQIIKDGASLDQKDVITPHKAAWIPDIFIDYNGKEFPVAYIH